MCTTAYPCKIHSRREALRHEIERLLHLHEAWLVTVSARKQVVVSLAASIFVEQLPSSSHLSKLLMLHWCGCGECSAVCPSRLEHDVIDLNQVACSPRQSLAAACEQLLGSKLCSPAFCFMSSHIRLTHPVDKGDPGSTSVPVHKPAVCSAIA